MERPLILHVETGKVFTWTPLSGYLNLLLLAVILSTGSTCLVLLNYLEKFRSPRIEEQWFLLSSLKIDFSIVPRLSFGPSSSSKHLSRRSLQMPISLDLM